MEKNKVISKVAEVLGIAVLIGGIMLSVGRMWVNDIVEQRLVEIAEDPGSHPAVVENKTKLATLEAGQVRIETKVDLFSNRFLLYLERQAEQQD